MNEIKGIQNQIIIPEIKHQETTSVIKEGSISFGDTISQFLDAVNTAQVDAKMALDAAKIRLEQLTAQYKPEHLTRFETLPVPPKFVPPLPIITEEIKKEIQPKVTRSKKKKKKK